MIYIIANQKIFMYFVIIENQKLIIIRNFNLLWLIKKTIISF